MYVFDGVASALVEEGSEDPGCRCSEYRFYGVGLFRKMASEGGVAAEDDLERLVGGGGGVGDVGYDFGDEGCGFRTGESAGVGEDEEAGRGAG